TVIVRHGNFLSVYQNLTKVYVKTGDNVKTKQVIGEISGTENENGNLLHLEIWKDYERLNPKEWLAN
ncbi:MAG: M23 family metallopeptidase, partial [Candidatus Methanofastidiosa archaeon]|nr:M23 family metallopeptidase [Candidatus Methanofastidiosa archaeon]